MNIRKIVAVLAAVLMFCSLIPMSVFAAPGDVILDKNFDDGNAFFERATVENGYMVFDATTADWQNNYQYVNGIKAKTNYIVTFKAKANKEASLAFKINNDWAGDTVKEAVDVTTEWQDYELNINSGELTNAVVMFASDYTASTAAIYNIDDLKIVETVDPALIGKVINGDFETGDNTGWETPQGTKIDTAAAQSGRYGAHLKGDGSWGGMLNQTIIANAGKTYEITLNFKVINNGVNIQIKDTNNVQLDGGWFDKNSASDWTTKTFIVTPDTNGILINFCGAGNGKAEEAYVDNISALELKDPSFDGYIYNGDFETGKTDSWESVWGSAQIGIVAGRDGGSAMSVDAGQWQVVRQKVNVEPNTDYVVSVYGKDASNMTLLVKDSNDSGNIAQTGFNGGSDWKKTSLNFNSGSWNQVYICVMGNVAGSHVVVDDFLMFEKVESSNDGYLVNGTFETGDIQPWENLWGSCPKAEVVTGGYNDRFALEIVSGQWMHVRQLPIAVEANTDYKITVYAKNTKDMALLVKDGGDTTNLANAGVNGDSEWTENVVEFNSGSYTAVLVSFMGNTAEAYGTFDNIIMEKVVPACEHDYEYDCDKVCALCGEETRPEATHEYFYACDAYCMLCGEKTNPSADHTILHVEAKEPVNCIEYGNREYWTCESCNVVWLDEACMMQTNMMSVRIAGECVSNAPACQDGVCVNCGLPYEATTDHAYDNVCDADCNLCGETREAGHTAGAAADCENDQVCTVCGAVLNAALGHKYNAVVTAPDCVNGGYTTYTCTVCGDSYVSDNTAALGHTAGAAADCENDQVCTVCGTVLNAALGHKYNAVVTEPDCVNGGYTTHTCSACGDSYVTDNTAALDHSYDDNCDIDCNRCGENREVPHGTITAVEAVAPTCTENGNLAYWYCESCGQAWLDAEHTLNTNVLAVILPAAHTYDDEADVDCNVCGEIREVYVPVVVLGNLGTSVSEDVNGLAFGFSVKVPDIVVENGNEFVSGSVAPYENGKEYTLVRMGAVVSNNENAKLDLNHLDGDKTKDVPAHLLYDVDIEDGNVEFAVRIIEIPNVGKNVTISACPYFIFDRNGEEIVCYGDVISSSYNEALL